MYLGSRLSQNPGELTKLVGQASPATSVLELAEQVEEVGANRPKDAAGRHIHAALVGSTADKLEVESQGQIAEYDTRILTLSVLKGFFAGRR